MKLVSNIATAWSHSVWTQSWPKHCHLWPCDVTWRLFVLIQFQCHSIGYDWLHLCSTVLQPRNCNSCRFTLRGRWCWHGLLWVHSPRIKKKLKLLLKWLWFVIVICQTLSDYQYQCSFSYWTSLNHGMLILDEQTVCIKKQYKIKSIKIKQMGERETDHYIYFKYTK